MWKRWRSVEKGEESAEDCRQDFLEFLAKINTLTGDGKTREVGGGDGDEESVPPMIVPNAENLPVPLLLTSSVARVEGTGLTLLILVVGIIVVFSVARSRRSE